MRKRLKTLTPKSFTSRLLGLAEVLLIVFMLTIAIHTSVHAQPGEDFTIIVLPDTQYYSLWYPEIFIAQTQWIVDNKDALNVVYVAHEGDIVQNAAEISEWDNADAAMSLLEDPAETGIQEGIPYGVLPGDHDLPTTLYNSYFGVARFQGRSYYGGHYSPSSNDNNFTLFSAGGMDFIVINLAYDSTPDTDVLNWADELLKIWPERRAILVSHYLIDTGEQANFSSQGQAIYDALKDNPNLFLLLCGHNGTEGIRIDDFGGNTIYTLLANYQGLPNGGNGWLRIMRFSPAADEITVTTYSPWLDLYGNDPVMGATTISQDFTLVYSMAEGPTVPPAEPLALTA